MHLYRSGLGNFYDDLEGDRLQKAELLDWFLISRL